MADNDVLSGTPGSPEAEKGSESAPSENSAVVSDETVEDILSGIMGGDGSFNEDFNGLYARYLGAGSQNPIADDESIAADIAVPDIGQHVEYEAPDLPKPEVRAAVKPTVEKMPEGVRVIYDAAEREAKRPEFTSGGTVKYPAMGTGASEERVVYDAEWEEKAKKEAARRESMRNETMLRGDSTYVRNFVSGGVPMAKRGSTAPKKPAVNPAYIDPLADDDIKPTPRSQTEILQNERTDISVSTSGSKSFFQDGFSAEKINNTAARGKTEDLPKSSSTDSDNADNAVVESIVLDAFAQSQESEEAFRARWKEQIEQAEKRKREKEKAQREKEKQLRAEKEKKAAAQRLQSDDKPGMPLDITGAGLSTAELAAKAVQTSASADAAAEKDAHFEFNMPSENIPKPEKLVVNTPVSRGRAGKAKDTKVSKTTGQKISFFLKTHFSSEGVKRFAKNTLPGKGDSKKEVIRKCVRILSFLAFIAAAIYLVIYFINYRERIDQQKDFYDDLTRYEQYDSDRLDEEWNNIKVQYPDVTFPEGMDIKFANLYAISQDVVGWLKIDNTNINTVLLQTDNDSYYLYKDIYGKYSRYGNPYVNCHCDMSISGPGKNTIIYGHNTHDGLMFHQLEKYMTVEGYLNAPIITFDTLYGQTKWKIFGVVLRNSTADADNGVVSNYFSSTYSSNSEFMSDVAEIKKRSMIHTGVDVVETDKMLTLYTCYQNIFEGGRLVVFARQLRDGESEEIDTNRVYYDSTALFPQAYYDKMGIKNPYYTPPEASVPATSASDEMSVPSVQTTEPVEETTKENVEVPF